MNAFSAVLSTEGRVIGLCWANQNLKDLKDNMAVVYANQGKNEEATSDPMCTLEFDRFRNVRGPGPGRARLGGKGLQEQELAQLYSG